MEKKLQIKKKVVYCDHERKTNMLRMQEKNRDQENARNKNPNNRGNKILLYGLLVYKI